MNLRSKPVLALSATALLGVVMLTACSSDSSDGDGDAPDTTTNGVEELSAEEILEEASTALEGATSVHIEGAITQQGSETEVDMQLSAEPAGATGTISVQGQTVTLVAVDSQVYFSADAAFWTSQGLPEAVLDQVADKYVEVPEGDNSFEGFTEFDEFTGELVSAEGDIEKGEESTVDGVPVIELIDTEDDGVLSIALEGEPLPLQVASAEEGEVRFFDWNEPVDLQAPPADDIVDLESLLGG